MSSEYQRARWREAQRKHRERLRETGWTAPGTTKPATQEQRRIYNKRYRERKKQQAWQHLIISVVTQE